MKYVLKLRFCNACANNYYLLCAEIRQEYQHVKHEAYCKGRSKILRDLLQQTSSIFATTEDTHAKRRSWLKITIQLNCDFQSCSICHLRIRWWRLMIVGLRLRCWADLYYKPQSDQTVTPGRVRRVSKHLSSLLTSVWDLFICHSVVSTIVWRVQ